MFYALKMLCIVRVSRLSGQQCDTIYAPRIAKRVIRTTQNVVHISIFLSESHTYPITNIRKTNVSIRTHRCVLACQRNGCIIFRLTTAACARERCNLKCFRACPVRRFGRLDASVRARTRTPDHLALTCLQTAFMCACVCSWTRLGVRAH